MRLTKIYTKVGDRGETMLATGEFVSKADARIEAYGTVDELNAHLGLLNELIAIAEKDNPKLNQSLFWLSKIQNELFDIGGELATPIAQLNLSRQVVVSTIEIERLEREIDEMNESLAPLQNFILPGGSLANAQAHVARTVCRRAEREIVRLSKISNVRPEAVMYVNRLSDWLFVYGRMVNQLLGAKEVLWQQRRPS